MFSIVLSLKENVGVRQEPISTVPTNAPNLEVITGANVQKVLIENEKAVGVLYEDNDGTTVKAMTAKEVILSAGAVDSPKNLMLSGIGPKSHLESPGIKVLKNLPGVGQNLNDHLDFILKFKCAKPVSI